MKIFDRTIETELKKPFPQNAVQWRSQSIIEDKNNKGVYAAQALAYIDARDVMNRLDEVVGVNGWRTSFSEAGKRVYCTIEIKIDDEWVGKTDAAGDTQVEAEKGAVSDALKRAAVNWGIGRYLYDFPTPWVKCEVYIKDGKPRFKKWIENPFSKLPAQIKQGI